MRNRAGEERDRRGNTRGNRRGTGERRGEVKDTSKQGCVRSLVSIEETVPFWIASSTLISSFFFTTNATPSWCSALAILSSCA